MDIEGSTPFADIEASTELAEREGIKIHTDITLQIVTFVLGGLGVVGNFVALVVFKFTKTFFKGKVRLIVMHQCFIDFCASLFLVLHTGMDGRTSLLGGVAGVIQCKVWNTKLFLWSAFLTSTLNLVLVAIDRYIAVIWPLHYKKESYQKSFYPSLIFIWVFAILWNVYKVPTTIVVDGKCLVYGAWPNFQTRQAVGLTNMVFYFLSPVIILAFCYVKIILYLGKKNKVSESADKKQTHMDMVKAKSRKNVIKTLVEMAIMFVVCWIWNQVYFLLLNLGVKLDFANPFYHFTVIMVTSHCCMNPFIYGFRYIRSLFSKKEVQPSTTESTVATVSQKVASPEED